MLYGARLLCLAVGVVTTVSPMSVRGAAAMLDNRDSSPLCVGRLSVELPSRAKPTIEATFQYMETLPPTQGSDFQSIKKELDRKKNDFAEQSMRRDARHDAMERAAGYDPDATYGRTKLVGYREDDTIQQIAIGYHPELTNSNTVSEVNKVIDGSRYRFTSSGFGADRYESVAAGMWSAARTFRPMRAGEVPATAGFCVDGGMFVDDGQPPVRESFTLTVQFKGHPDASFSIDSDAIDKVDSGEPSLKRRADDDLKMLRESVDGHVDVLVRGDREAAGQKGYQIGLSVPSDVVPGTSAYKFFWAADGVPNDAARPHLEVDLVIQPEDGKPVTIRSADEARALWESLLKGIRVRPGSVAR